MKRIILFLTLGLFIDAQALDCKWQVCPDQDEDQVEVELENGVTATLKKPTEKDVEKLLRKIEQVDRDKQPGENQFVVKLKDAATATFEKPTEKDVEKLLRKIEQVDGDKQPGENQFVVKLKDGATATFEKPTEKDVEKLLRSIEKNEDVLQQEGLEGTEDFMNLISKRKQVVWSILRLRQLKSASLCGTEKFVESLFVVANGAVESAPLGGFVMTTADRLGEDFLGLKTAERQREIIGEHEGLRTPSSILGGAGLSVFLSMIGLTHDAIEYVQIEDSDERIYLTGEAISAFGPSAYARTIDAYNQMKEPSKVCSDSIRSVKTAEEALAHLDATTESDTTVSQSRQPKPRHNQGMNYFRGRSSLVKEM